MQPILVVVISGLALTAAYDPLIDRLAPAGFSFTPPSRTAHNSCLYPTDPGCKLQCRPHDPVLERALAPWWDVKLDSNLWRTNCDTVGERWGQAYLGRISNGELWYKRCSRGSDDEPVDDLMLLFGVLLQLAEEIGLPDLEFTFNMGDQPFTDRSYWAPVSSLCLLAAATVSPGVSRHPCPYKAHIPLSQCCSDHRCLNL